MYNRLTLHGRNASDVRTHPMSGGAGRCKTEEGNMTKREKGREGGIVFSETEERAVEGINALDDVVRDKQFEIGRIADALVEEKGGTVYGESTLERLSQHPNLKCCYEELRRCWHFFQLKKLYGEQVKQVAPGLSYSHLYQLSRLLQVEDEKVQREAVLAMAKKAADDGMNSTDLGNSVTNHLEFLGIAARRKPKRKDTGETTAPEEQESDVCYAALAETTETLVLATGMIVAAKGVERVAEVRNATNRLGFAYVQLVRKLVGSGDVDASIDARKVADSLADAIAARNANEGVRQ